MPPRQGGMLANRVSTWPRDHFWRSTMAPRISRPTTWNEFLPISMPTTAIALSGFWGALLVFGAPSQLLTLVGQEHGRTIPLSDIGSDQNLRPIVGHFLLAARSQSARLWA